jgi:hypothetical protein
MYPTWHQYQCFTTHIAARFTGHKPCMAWKVLHAGAVPLQCYANTATSHQTVSHGVRPSGGSALVLPSVSQAHLMDGLDSTCRGSHLRSCCAVPPCSLSTAAAAAFRCSSSWSSRAHLPVTHQTWVDKHLGSLGFRLGACYFLKKKLPYQVTGLAAECCNQSTV